MSTSDSKSGAPGSGNDNVWNEVWLGSKDVPAGLPDPAVLARLANEFFTALPEFAQASSITPDVPAQVSSLPAGPAGAEPPGLIPQGVGGVVPPTASLTEAQLRALPSTLAGSSAPSPPDFGGVPSSLPTIPGDFAAIRFSDASSFSFLEEARPIFADAAAFSPRSSATPLNPTSLSPGALAQLPSVPAGLAGAEPPVALPGVTGIASPTAFPSEAELRALPATLASFSAPSLPGFAGISSPLPTIPGDFSAIRFSDVPCFSFLEEARPIFADAAGSPARSSAIEQNSPESDLRAATATAPDLGDLSGTKSVAAPLVPGAWVRPEANERATSYGFLGEARQLIPAEVAPALAPATSQVAVLPDLGLSSRSFEVGEIRRDFPILQERVNGRPLIWLDNAATTQKPQSVIDRLDYFYAHENSNVHRAAHEMAARATDAYEAAREKVRRFLNASTVREIIFVRGATEGVNLVAQSWGRQNIGKDDEIVITWLEHHANIVPWQMLCAEKGARLRVAPVDDTGQVLLDEYTKLVGPRTRLVSFAQVSNALGTITPAPEMIEIAHRHGAKVLLDGAQAVSHLAVDVQSLDCDFYVFSGHKLFAPTGIGAVYGKLDILEQTQPWQGGGSMILDVTFEKTVYNVPPGRFEAGTGSIADAVGLGAAIDYVQRLGLPNIARYEHDLLAYATEGLLSVPGLRLVGTAKEKASVLSFVLDGFRTEDVGAALNREGIAVRAGHHCAQPIHRRFGLESTVRASLALYNTCEEVDALVAALWSLKEGRHTGIL
jgi:cysteine desulfurase / selenocysteine lyase